MNNNRINEYVYLLKLSKDLLSQSIDEYNYINKEEIELSENHRLYYQRKYHAFAYSQLMYALYERLQSEADSTEKIQSVKKAFKTNRKSAIRKVCVLFANKVKHAKQTGSINISPSQTLRIDVSSGNIEVGPERLTLSSLDESNKIHPDLYGVDVLQLIEESYKQLLIFLEKEGYEY